MRNYKSGFPELVITENVKQVLLSCEQGTAPRSSTRCAPALVTVVLQRLDERANAVIGSPRS